MFDVNSLFDDIPESRAFQSAECVYLLSLLYAEDVLTVPVDTALADARTRDTMVRNGSGVLRRLDGRNRLGAIIDTADPWLRGVLKRGRVTRWEARRGRGISTRGSCSMRSRIGGAR